MMSVEHFVELEFAGEAEVVEENLPQYHFFNNKAHMT
jgi:hypothetical protein